MYKPKYFILQELVCPHVHEKWGEFAWQFFDEKLLITIDIIREHLGPFYGNNWDMDENKRKDLGLPLYDERGLRCIWCSIVKKAIENNVLYFSTHMRAQAFDGDVDGHPAENVRLWCAVNKNIFPYPIRLEKGVKWVHVDTMDAGKGKVYLFNK